MQYDARSTTDSCFTHATSFRGQTDVSHDMQPGNNAPQPCTGTWLHAATCQRRQLTRARGLVNAEHDYILDTETITIVSRQEGMTCVHSLKVYTDLVV